MVTGRPLTGRKLSARQVSRGLGILALAGIHCMLSAKHAAAQPAANALQRLVALRLPRLHGPVPVYYSAGVKETAVRDQAAIAACANWYSQQLHVTVPVTVAVLNQADWKRVGALIAYPMPQAEPEAGGNVLFMPDSFDSFPGQGSPAEVVKKLDFISFHETGHLFQRKLKLEGPDLFMQEFTATMLATAYALVARPDLVAATVDSRAGSRQRYTSFEDLDLVYFGVGFDNYDWLQVETARLAVFFVKGQDLASLVDKLHAAFPPGQVMSNRDVLAKLDVIRPGFLAQAGDLAHSTTLPLLAPGKCAASPATGSEDGFVGVWNGAGHAVQVMDDGTPLTLDPGYTAEQGKVGAQLRLPSGLCVTYPAAPGYITLK